MAARGALLETKVEDYWLKDGDANTRFFHLSTLQRRRSIRIVKIDGGNGIWIENERDIRLAFENFYEDLFKLSGSRD